MVTDTEKESKTRKRHEEKRASGKMSEQKVREKHFEVESVCLTWKEKVSLQRIIV